MIVEGKQRKNSELHLTNIDYTLHPHKKMDVREALLQVLGEPDDEAVLDYCASMLEDEDFEWGNDAETAAESLGPFLVRRTALPFPHFL